MSESAPADYVSKGPYVAPGEADAPVARLRIYAAEAGEFLLCGGDVPLLIEALKALQRGEAVSLIIPGVGGMLRLDRPEAA